MAVIEGVDYSYDPPSPAGLVTAGKRFVVRYGALGNTAKYLDAAEVAALRAAGLEIVANVEETARAYRGAAAGTRHATAGDLFFRALGMPAGSPIYFSVDWDAGPADWPDIDAALRASAAVLGPGRVGVYGSYDTIAHCAAAGTAAWFWQTYAWSGGRWHPAADLQQYKNNVALAGGTVDLTRAVTTDYGQWGGGAMTFAPESSLAVRHKIQEYTGQSNVELGITRDERDTSYHVGRSWLISGAYSVSESSRDRNGLSEASSAIDIGYFSFTKNGKTHTLRTFSRWLVAECERGAPDTLDIREIIYSLDGQTVKRWDRLGKRTTGPISHTGHTHVSWFRDSENHDRVAVFARYFAEEVEGGDVSFEDDQVPINYPAANPDNPTWTGPNALGQARDLAAESRDRIKTVQQQMALNQAALMAALANADDGNAVIAAVREEGARLSAAAAAEATRDAATAAAIASATRELAGLRELLQAAGGDPDLAPVLARLDGLVGVIQTSGVQAGQQAAAAVLNRLASAQDAEAAALRRQE